MENYKTDADGYKELDKLTVVICSYERPKQLSETLSYLRQSRLNAIVVDGSKIPLESVELESHKDGSLTYIHKPTPSLLTRLGIAASLVKTPYAILMFDDEYYLPSALVAAIRFLEDNPSYVSCGGQAVGFSASNSEILWRKVYETLDGFDLSDSDPLDRVNKHFSEYRIASYCSVVRTLEWSKAWREIAKKQFPPYGVQELQFECAMSFCGKIKILSELMWLRNLDIPSIKNVGVRNLDDNLPFQDWWTITSEPRARREFVEVMSDILLEASNNGETSLNRPLMHDKLTHAFANYSRYWRTKNNKVHQLLSGFLLGIQRILSDREQLVINPAAAQTCLPKQTYVDKHELQFLTDRILKARGN